MRRLLAVAGVALLCAGCGSDLLGPVATCDGDWVGTQNGYNVGFVLVQTDSVVAGTVQITGALGFAQGTVSGTCVNPKVNLTLSISGFSDVAYTGTLSATNAVITGKLNGSGFVDTEVDIKKK